MRTAISARARVPGALFVIGSLVGLVGNVLHPHVAIADELAALKAIADYGAWPAIHLAIIIAILLIVGGFVGLALELSTTEGALAARLGVAAALVGGAIVTISTAIDGFAMQRLAIAAASDPEVALQIAVGIETAGFAIWSIGMLVFFGAAFACFGVSMLQSQRYPARYGWTAVVGAAGSATAALVQIGSGGETQAAESIFLASSLLLTVWTLAVGVRTWRAVPDTRAVTLTVADRVGP